MGWFEGWFLVSQDALWSSHIPSITTLAASGKTLPGTPQRLKGFKYISYRSWSCKLDGWQRNRTELKQLKTELPNLKLQCGSTSTHKTQLQNGWHLWTIFDTTWKQVHVCNCNNVLFVLFLAIPQHQHILFSKEKLLHQGKPVFRLGLASSKPCLSKRRSADAEEEEGLYVWPPSKREQDQPSFTNWQSIV